MKIIVCLFLFFLHHFFLGEMLTMFCLKCRTWVFVSLKYILIIINIINFTWTSPVFKSIQILKQVCNSYTYSFFFFHLFLVLTYLFFYPTLFLKLKIVIFSGFQLLSLFFNFLNDEMNRTCIPTPTFFYFYLTVGLLVWDTSQVPPDLST